MAVSSLFLSLAADLESFDHVISSCSSNNFEGDNPNPFLRPVEKCTDSLIRMGDLSPSLALESSKSR